MIDWTIYLILEKAIILDFVSIGNLPSCLKTIYLTNTRKIGNNK